MREQTASRTLVKSHPELWSECSDAASLARHLGQYGEIRITRLEPESTVAWEGEQVSGTVRLEPAGWGTRVTLTVEEAPMPGPPAPPAPAPDPPPPAPPGPAPVPEPPPQPPDPRPPQPQPQPPGEPLPPAAQSPVRRGKLAWLRSFFLGEPDMDEEQAVTPSTPELESDPEPAHDPEPADHPEPAQVPEPAHVPEPAANPQLAAALDSLGQAHHRPFSRA